MLPCLETKLLAAPGVSRSPRIYGSDSLRCAIRWLGSLRSAARVSLNSMRRRGARIIGRRLFRCACLQNPLASVLQAASEPPLASPRLLAESVPRSARLAQTAYTWMCGWLPHQTRDLAQKKTESQ